MDLAEIIDAAAGRIPCDCCSGTAKSSTCCRVKSCLDAWRFTAGRIVATEETSSKRVLDLGGRFVAPGFIDAHVTLKAPWRRFHSTPAPWFAGDHGRRHRSA